MHAQEQPKQTGEAGRSPRPAVRPATATNLPPTAVATAAGILSLQRRVGNAAVARMVKEERHQHGAGCGHEQAKAPVQRRAAVHEPPPTQRRSAAHEVLNTPGDDLDPAMRTEMESRFGRRLPPARVHRGPLAERAAAELGAQAFTSQGHMVFGRGAWNKPTIAHEMRHLEHQSAGPVPGTDNGNGFSVSDENCALEKDAEAHSVQAMRAPALRAPAASTEGATAGVAGAGDVSPVQRSALPPVQRMRIASGNVAFTNVAGRHEESVGKATRVLQLLKQHPTIRPYIGDRKCDIVLEKRTTETPADVVDKGADGVEVTIASYYFENYDIGYIVGMLSHEFAMHPLANAKPNTAREEEGFRGMPIPVPGLETTKLMNSDGAKQPDHVLGAIPGAPRYEIYKAVALEMAKLLLDDVANNEEGARQKDVTDLLDCFLMDVATIAATNDKRLLGTPLRPGSQEVRNDIATVYNRYKQLLSNDPSLDEAVKPFFPRDKTSEDVRQDFLTLAGRIFKGGFNAWSISGKDNA